MAPPAETIRRLLLRGVPEPVPPLVTASVPETAAAWLRFSGPKTGWLEPLTVSTWYWAPAAVAESGPAPPPTRTPLLAKLVAPVPPSATARVPDVICASERLGI